MLDAPYKTLCHPSLLFMKIVYTQYRAFSSIVSWFKVILYSVLRYQHLAHKAPCQKIHPFSRVDQAIAVEESL